MTSATQKLVKAAEELALATDRAVAALGVPSPVSECVRVRAALSALAQEQDGWIDVRERLPEKNIPVIIWNVRTFRTHVESYAEINECYFDSPEEALENSVTHWRPLPPPPGAQVAALPERPTNKD